jgi:hypothetical protein
MPLHSANLERRLSKVEDVQSAERFGRIETDIAWIKWVQGAVLVVWIGQFVQSLLAR